MNITVLQNLEKIARIFPDKIAYADIKEEYTFSEVEVLSKKIGSMIAKKIEPNNPIIVYMDKRAYNIVAFMGVVYAGCFYVPIDSQMPVERINLIMDTLNPSLILYDDVTFSKLEAFDRNISKVHYKEAINTEINEQILFDIRSNVKNTDLLYVLFTSGSTGIPKGVTISHAAIIDFMEWICMKYDLNEKITMCNQAPFYFDASVPDIYIPLRTGATLYIPPKNYYTFPKKILEYVCDKEINTLIWVPSALCNVVNCRAFEVCIPKSIRLVIFCGEVMPCKHLNVWRKNIPNALYVNMYGPTEATYACMYYNIEKDFKDEEKLPLGKACENSKIIILNDDDKLVTNNEVGEICILGQCLSYGYYNEPNQTNKVFVQNPTNKKWNETMYRTGDLALINNQGEIIFVGRKDSQIKKLGHRIELGEIENAILAEEAIENACCIYNENIEEMVAIYVGKLEIKMLKEKLLKKLPNYMQPDKFEQLKEMPLNLNGKIDRAKLKKIYTENRNE